jgi:hypothetical protein
MASSRKLLSLLSQRGHSSVVEGPAAMKALLPDEQIEAVVLAEILEVLGVESGER